jgi:hypothetical protein
VASSVAGTALAQAKGSDVERSQTDAHGQQLRAQSEVKAEDAAGIGATDGEDHEAADRDANGRRLWEDTGRRGPAAGSDARQAPLSKDASGQSGNLLDLSG